MGMTIFILPPTCVERASMGVLLILSIVLISLMLESYTPKNSTNISVIGKLVGFTMFMITWSTVISTSIIGIDRENFTNKTLPTWLKTLMVKYIGRLVCKEETINATLNSAPINRNEEIELLDTSRLAQQNQQENNNDVTNSSVTQTPDLANLISSGNNESENQDYLKKTKSELDQSKKLLVLINNQIAMLRIRLQEKDIKEQNKKDWYLIACSLDRFFLYVYIVVMFFGIFVIFI
jgi:hypothetical protein